MKLRILLLATSILFFTTSIQSFGQIKKKVVFEMFTSASCGNCPTGIGEIQRILDVYGDDCIIWISHHAGWLWDPMVFGEITTIASNFTSGAPTGMIDRKNNLGTTWLATTPSNWEDQIIDHLALPPKAGLNFSGNYNALDRSLDFSVTTRFESSVSPGDLRLNVMILEDRVNEGTANYNQSNYFNNSPGHPFEGAGNPIIGYQHRNVTRAVLDAAWGTENVIPDNPSLNTDYTATYSYTLPENFDETKISIVAFISYFDDDPDNRQVINGDVVHINDLTTTGTNNISYLESFEVMPNPAAGSTTIQLNSKLAKTLTVKLLNFQGQAVRDWKTELLTGLNTLPVDLSDLSPGAYLLMVNDGVETATRRVVVR